MSIAGIGSSQIGYDNLSSGKRINTAADNPAGMAIAQKHNTQITGYDVGKNNAAAGKDLINVADGALSNITDSLQRMRELGMQASNSATMTDSDRSSIQKEIENLKKGIQDTVKGTSYNKLTLLDGSIADMNLATNPNGKGQSIKLVSSTLQDLGIEDFDVTGEFSLKTIDEAIAKITEGRSSLGAQSNALDSQINYNNYASYNTSAAKSSLEDLDMAEGITEMKKNKIIEDYRLYIEKQKMEDDEDQNLVKKMFG